MASAAPGFATSKLDLPFVIVPGIVTPAFVFSAGVGVLFGFVPARKAARLNPIEASAMSSSFRIAILTLLLALPAATTAQVVTPDDALERAMEHSPALRGAVLELEQARQAVEREDWRYVPSLAATIGYTHAATPSLGGRGISIGSSEELALGVALTHQFAFGTALGADIQLNGAGRDFVQPDLIDPLVLGPTYGFSVNVSVSQPILRGFGTDVGEAELRAARHSATAADLARQRTASEVARDVLAAWWELWYAQAATAIQARGVEVSAQQLQEAEVRIETGAIAPLDALPFRTEAAQVREALSTAEIDVRQRQVALARLLGAPLTAALQASADAPAQVVALPEPEAVVEAAERHAYELGELAAVVAQTEAQVELAEDQAKPQLDAVAWVTFAGLGDEDAGAAFEMFGRGEAVSGFVGVELGLPIINRSRRAEAQRARLAVDAAETRLELARETTAAQAVQQLEALRAALSRFRFAEETARLAAQAAEGQRERFTAGAGTALELVIAEQDRRAAELRVARARADIAIARATLAHLTGALLEDVLEATNPG